MEDANFVIYIVYSFSHQFVSFSSLFLLFCVVECCVVGHFLDTYTFPRTHLISFRSSQKHNDIHTCGGYQDIESKTKVLKYLKRSHKERQKLSLHVIKTTFKQIFMYLWLRGNCSLRVSLA
uniref:Uncharacterized protein n=1 Tax=Glossina palpalis gambiensis TaxID=67801 RepID=A0A1B0BIY1_9MUSC